ncbi:uncharacterized protein LOC143305034 [Bombus vancouverensis nearcticus]|uniref:uncharacterized protein LOC143305034 n=1 Tax=Bombus vancouverensis nearcticus TaxID=2705178 RepID=UPI00402B4215
MSKLQTFEALQGPHPDGFVSSSGPAQGDHSCLGKLARSGQWATHPGQAKAASGGADLPDLTSTIPHPAASARATRSSSLSTDTSNPTTRSSAILTGAATSTVAGSKICARCVASVTSIYIKGHSVPSITPGIHHKLKLLVYYFCVICLWMVLETALRLLYVLTNYGESR